MSKMEQIKAYVDRKLEKFLSRKLLVWIMSTVLLWFDKVDGEQWVALSLAYVCVQGVTDAATQWKHGKSS